MVDIPRSTIDADIRNAEWTKKAFDLGRIDSEEILEQQVESLGMSWEELKKNCRRIKCG